MHIVPVIAFFGSVSLKSLPLTYMHSGTELGASTCWAVAFALGPEPKPELNPIPLSVGLAGHFRVCFDFLRR